MLAEARAVAQGAADPGHPEIPEPAQELGERILAAFNLAYSEGRREVAQSLIEALDLCLQPEDRSQAEGARRKAGLWMRFVQIRDRYISLRAARGEAAADTAAAARAMREAYVMWSRA